MVRCGRTGAEGPGGGPVRGLGTGRTGGEGVRGGWKVRGGGGGGPGRKVGAGRVAVGTLLPAERELLGHVERLPEERREQKLSEEPLEEVAEDLDEFPLPGRSEGRCPRVR